MKKVLIILLLVLPTAMFAQNIGFRLDAGLGAGLTFGVAPELGIAFGNFKLSAMYHFVGGNTLVDIGAGDPKEVSNNYLGILMSFRVFGVNDRE